VEHRSAAETAVRLAGQVGGVVQVVGELGYETDDTLLAGMGPWPTGVA
jgi:hypothetical protein